MKIKFSKPMRIPQPWYDKLEKDRVAWKSLKASAESGEKRMLAESHVRDLIKIRMIKSSGQAVPRGSDFKWYFSEVSPSAVEVQLYFKEAELISMSDQKNKDKVEISFNARVLK